MLIESIALVGFGAVVALLIAIAMELRTLRQSVDATSRLLSDAVGIPVPDIIEARHAEPGSVTISRQFEDLLRGDEEREETPSGENHS